MKRTAISFVFVLIISLGAAAAQHAARYVFVDADCKQGFELAPDANQKRIITNIKLFEFEDPAQALFAEDHIKSEFKKVIQALYPTSINQFEGIYVYMLNDSDQAMEKRDELIAEYKNKNVHLIDLEF